MMQQTTQYMYLTLLVVFKLLLIDMSVQAYIPVDDNTISIMMNLKYKKKHNITVTLVHILC